MKKKNNLFLVIISIAIIVVVFLTVAVVGKSIFNTARERPVRCISNGHECGDCTDNDNDGLTDYKVNKKGVVTGDPDCTSLTDDTESEETPCSPECYDNSDCGTNGYIGEPYCKEDGNLYKDYETSFCYNPGECIASCNSQINSSLLEECEGSCSSGHCINDSEPDTNETGPDTNNTEPDTNETGPDTNITGGILQFKSGFEADTYVLDDDIKGIDNSGLPGANNWDNLSGYLPWVLYGDAYFEGGTMYISTDPFNSTNKVLDLHTFQDAGGYARSQWELEQVHNWYVEGEPNLFEQQFYTFRILIPERIDTLYSTEERAGWYMIWESHAWDFEPTRHGIYLVKLAGSDRWGFRVVQQSSINSEYLYENTQYYYDVDVPIGEWFTMDIFFKYHESDGQFYAAIQRYGGERQVIANLTGQTKYGTKLHDQMMFKLYHHSDYLNRSQALGLDGIHQYYDNFEIWSDYPPNYQ